MSRDQAHEEVLVLLRNAWEDIERTKQRQWRDVYHVLIAQGAIVGLFVATVQHAPHWFGQAFALATILLTVAGVGIVKASQDTLTQQRNLIERGYYTLLHHKELVLGQLSNPVHRSTYPGLYVWTLIGTGIFAVVVIFGLGFHPA